jgi:hypothetical protein
MIDVPNITLMVAREQPAPKRRNIQTHLTDDELALIRETAARLRTRSIHIVTAAIRLAITGSKKYMADLCDELDKADRDAK